MQLQPLRLFIAAELTSEVRQALGRLQDDLKRKLPPKVIRWTNPDGIHLTLKFLGDTPADKAPAVVQALEQAAAGFEPFVFQVAGFGCFPNPRKARVLWVGIPQMPKTLSDLQRALDLQLTRLGYAKEDRPFSPHLTLGRVNDSISAGERQALSDLIARTEVGSLGTVPVHEVILFKSDLKPTGAVYTALTRAPLVAVTPE